MSSKTITNTSSGPFNGNPIFFRLLGVSPGRSACVSCGWAGSFGAASPGLWEVRRGSVCRSDRLFGLPNIVPALKFSFITLWALFGGSQPWKRPEFLLRQYDVDRVETDTG